MRDVNTFLSFKYFGRPWLCLEFQESAPFLEFLSHAQHNEFKPNYIHQICHIHRFILP